MGRWLEKRSNWLRNNDNFQEDQPQHPEKNDRGYGVVFIPLRCPKCNSKNVKCYGSHPPVRYHYCRDCGYNFKSVEKDYEK
jgi:predicted Zn-ribbon and HTH transcriptional regulator